MCLGPGKQCSDVDVEQSSWTNNLEMLDETMPVGHAMYCRSSMLHRSQKAECLSCSS
jgi:hypothetical protein